MEKVRIELFVAWPPTSRCEKLIELVKKVVQDFGERVEVNVYHRGQPYPVEPSPGFMFARKTLNLPAVLIDGKVLAEKEIPAEETLRQALKKKLGIFT